MEPVEEDVSASVDRDVTAWIQVGISCDLQVM